MSKQWDDNRRSDSSKTGVNQASAPPEPMDRNRFSERMKKLTPGIEDEAASKLFDYYASLLKFNNTLNLISATTVKTAESIHFADSVLAARMISKSLIPNEQVFDLGSGNGFPGLVMAVLYPKLKITLIDRDQRKVEFLKHVISTLKLTNATTEVVSVEEIAAGRMKNVVSRGFAPLHRTLLVARKQVGKGGRCFHLKGDGWANEIASVPSQLFSFWSPSLLGQYRLPETTNDMAVVLTEKIAE